jgi:hypothetical protein
MRKADRMMAGQNHAASEPRLGIYLAKSRFLSQVLDYQVACHGSLWRFWLRGTSADEHRKCDEGLDGTFHLCHIFRREAPAPAMLHALKLALTRLAKWGQRGSAPHFFNCDRANLW